MRRARRTAWWLAVALGISVFAAAGCGQPKPAAPPQGQPGAAPAQPGGAQAGQATRTARPPIKIGVLTDRSGALQGYGTQQVRGLELGLAYATGGTMEVAGRRIELIVEDDGSDPAKGKQKVIKLLEQDKVDIVQGTDSSAVALAVIPEIEKARKIFMVDPAAADQITGANFSRYVFRTGRNVSQDAAAAQYAVEKLGKTFVHLAPDYAFGKSSVAAWNPAFEKYGGKVLDTIYAPLQTTDFTSYLNKALEKKPEVLMVTWAGDGAIKLFQQINELGINQKVKVWTGIGDIPSLKAMGTSAAGSVGVVNYFHLIPNNPVNRWLVEEHQKKHREPPDLFTQGGFAAGVAIVEGLKKTGGDPDAEKLVPALEGLAFETPKGTMTFRKEDHQAIQVMYIARLEKKDGFDYPVPTLVEEIAAEKAAPPIQVKK